MNKNQKAGIIFLMGGAGAVVLLIGIFTSAYDFTTGLIIAIAIWILTGALSTAMGVKKEKK